MLPFHVKVPWPLFTLHEVEEVTSPRELPYRSNSSVVKALEVPAAVVAEDGLTVM